MTLYLGIGANIGEREATIRQAIRALGERIGTPAGCSSLYETRPSGFSSRHLFLNAVAAFETELAPYDLLSITQEVERELGRAEKTVGGEYHDRTIDIDLLLLGDTIIRDRDLTLPHPRLEERRFVLEPLCELAPELRHPQSGLRMKDLLENLNRLKIKEATPDMPGICEALNRLLPALTSSASPLTEANTKALLTTPGTHIYIGYDEENRIMASATLCLCNSPTGRKAWAEDVVVSPESRGRGYGKALMAHLQQESIRYGAKSLNLTSKPERTTANALYRKAGFIPRTTNVYRWTKPSTKGCT